MAVIFLTIKKPKVNKTISQFVVMNLVWTNVYMNAGPQAGGALCTDTPPKKISKIHFLDNAFGYLFHERWSFELCHVKYL